MTDFKEEKRKAFNEMQELISCCALEPDKNKRISYGKALSISLRSMIQYINNEDKFIDDLIARLSAAAETIMVQDDWLDYLEIAMEDQKEEIIHKASLEREAVEKYKKKHKRG